jgi:hypothetical protein
MKTIFTPGGLKSELGPACWTWLRRFDQHDKERLATDRAGDKLRRFEPPRRCWACGCKQRKGLQVQKAHIFPIEEGGKTIPQDLVPLCRRRMGRRVGITKEQLIRTLGCHDLVDFGMTSRVALLQLQSRLSPDPSFRDRLIEVADSCGQELLGKYVIKGRISTVRRVAGDVDLLLHAWNSQEKMDREAVVKKLCSAASTVRRAWYDGAVEDAEAILRHVSKLDLSHVSPDLRSTWQYEAAYLNLLRGDPKAEALFRASAKHAESALSKSMSQGQALVAAVVTTDARRLRRREKAIDRRWSKLLRSFVDARDQLLRVRKLSDKQREQLNHANRWIQSSLIHWARFQIKVHRFSRAEQLLHEWELFRRGLHAGDGWTIAMVPLANITFGLVGAYQRRRRDEKKILLRRLALGTRLMICDPRKRMEGVADAVLALGNVLCACGSARQKTLGRAFRCVACRIFDPLSLDLEGRLCA